MLALAGIVFAAMSPGVLLAQSPSIDDVKAKIIEAKAAQQQHSAMLKHCSELDGSHFYMQQRDRVIGLEDFHRSLENLVKQAVFNAETKRPWNQQDADARWAEVTKEAQVDKTNCALVASLPLLEKKLAELQQQAPTAQSSK